MSWSARDGIADLTLTEKNGKLYRFTIPLEQLLKVYLEIEDACTREIGELYDAGGPRRAVG